MEGHADGAPTFEDLAIDDSLGDLERIQKYAYSNIALQRYGSPALLVDYCNEPLRSVFCLCDAPFWWL